MFTLLAPVILQSGGTPGPETAAPTTLSVDLSRSTSVVSPSLYGIFFEEINAAGEGGIYGEKLRNRGLESVSGADSPAEIPQDLPGWRSDPGVTIVADGPNAAHSHAFSLPDGATITNSGWGGLAVEKGARYHATVWAKGPGRLDMGFGIGWVKTKVPGEGWKRIEKTIRPSGSASNSAFSVKAVGGSLEVGYVSLMPEELWKRRRNGLRPDLANLVADMHPAFVRFPGGCYVEGGDRFEDAFDWKASVGPVDERKGLARSMWGYPVSNGLGYHEFLQWCEDLDAAPLYVVNTGLNHKQATPLEGMDKWIQSALDAIEYANGPVSSPWGSMRAKNGHPKPFGLKYVEIGNENGANWSYGGPAAYAPRYQMMRDAIKAKYPEIVTIVDNPVPGSKDIIDEHYYSDPDWFWRNKDRYDGYDRGGSKVYVGEYAVTQGAGKGNLDAALAEAAFMTGMERNSDVVAMSSYAPLLTNVHDQQWSPDAIRFNAGRAFGTPSYHVQAMFANNRADRNVALTLPEPVTTAPAPRGGGVGLMTWSTQAEFTGIRISADDRTLYSSDGIRAAGLSNAHGDWSVSHGVVTQSSLDTDRTISVANATLPSGDYTLDVKARKLSGKEGFLIVVEKNGEKQLRWNVGGWGNTGTAFERDGTQVGDRVPVTIEPARWYDVRLERRGNVVRGYLDGKLIQELRETGISHFAAVAGIDDKAHELVLKVVNGSDEARPVTLDLVGGRVKGTVRAIVLTGSKLDSENSFDAPDAIAPKTMTLAWDGTCTFAPRSVTVLRLPIR